jgi:ligand-binding SRPBCC domain-containing protein
MATIRVETTIAAPIERCFDLARDIDFHVKSLAATGERAVAGRMAGLIELGESVTWEGRHFGVRQRFTARVTEFDRPRYFRDVMVAGAFREFAHDHRFEERDGVTLMSDVVTFRAPGGVLGRVVDAVLLKRYLRRLIGERGMAIQREAEGENFWPFDQPPDCLVVTLRSIVFDGAPILRVSHDADDHGWQFLDGEPVDESRAAVVALRGSVRIDPTVLKVADLPPGWSATRVSVSSPWTRFTTVGE